MWSYSSDILSPEGPSARCPGLQVWHFQLRLGSGRSVSSVMSSNHVQNTVLGGTGGAASVGTGRLSYCREPAWICDRQQHLHARQQLARSPWWGGRQETQVQGQHELYNETLVQETKTVAETHCPLCVRPCGPEFRLAGQVRSPGSRMRRSQCRDISDVPQRDSART